MPVRRTLGVALRCWPDRSIEHWTHVFDALWRSMPTLKPRTFRVVLGDIEPKLVDLAWDETRFDALVRACADTKQFSWTTCGDDLHLVDCEAREGRVVIDVLLPVTSTPPLEQFVELFETTMPAIGLVYDREHDGALGEQGLRAFRRISPILALDARAIEAFGGREHVRAAPCEVRELANDGLLLVASADPFALDKAARTRIAAVAAHLNVTEATPRILIP